MASSLFKGSIILIMVVTGAINTIDFKFQNSQYLYEGPVYKLFFHPYIQTLFMFIAQFISLPLFKIRKHYYPDTFKERQAKAVQEGKKLNMNKLLLLVPASLDLLTSTMQFMALNFISGSAYQLFRGGAIITTYLFSVLIFKQKVQRPQLMGTIIALIGLIVIGIANIIFAIPAQSNGMLQIIGYILIIGSLVINGFFFAFQQKLFQTFYLQPLQVVGYEGMFGFSLIIIIVPIISFIPCSFGTQACVFTQNGDAYLEGWKAFSIGVSEDPILKDLIVFSVITVAIYNVAGVSITKHINALARAIAANTKTVLVWSVGIIVTLTLGRDHPNYRWQSLNWLVILLQLIGFILLVIGNLVYNSIIKVKIPQFLTRISPDYFTEEVQSQK